MSFTPIWPIALMFLTVPVDASVGRPAVPAHTIILVGADWCAPCVAELGRLPALARAAMPNRLVLAWTDRPARLPREAAQLGVTQVPLAKARELMAQYGEGNSALPLVVMVRDDGSACATLRESLTNEGIGALRKNCEADREGLQPRAAKRPD